MPNGWNEKTGRYFLVFLLLGSAAALLSVIWVFAIPVILAVALTALLHPLYRKLVSFTGNRKNLSSFIACAVLLLILIVPVGFITQLLVRQAVDLSQSAGAQITAIAGDDQQPQNFLGKIRRSGLFSGTFLSAIDWDAIIRDAAGTRTRLRIHERMLVSSDRNGGARRGG